MAEESGTQEYRNASCRPLVLGLNLPGVGCLTRYMRQSSYTKNQIYKNTPFFTPNNPPKTITTTTTTKQRFKPCSCLAPQRSGGPRPSIRSPPPPNTSRIKQPSQAGTEIIKMTMYIALYLPYHPVPGCSHPTSSL